MVQEAEALPQRTITCTQTGCVWKSLALHCPVSAGSLVYLNASEIWHSGCFTCWTALQAGNRKCSCYCHWGSDLSTRLAERKKGLINVGWAQWLRLKCPRVSGVGGNTENMKRTCCFCLNVQMRWEEDERRKCEKLWIGWDHVWEQVWHGSGQWCHCILPRSGQHWRLCCCKWRPWHDPVLCCDLCVSLSLWMLPVW